MDNSSISIATAYYLTENLVAKLLKMSSVIVRGCSTVLTTLLTTLLTLVSRTSRDRM